METQILFFESFLIPGNFIFPFNEYPSIYWYNRPLDQGILYGKNKAAWNEIQSFVPVFSYSQDIVFHQDKDFKNLDSTKKLV